MGHEEAKASRKPRADSLRNREKLLQAATEVFREGGPGASLDAVAKRAEVGIGTLYRHFPTRDALFAGVYRRDVDRLADMAEMLAAEAGPMEALRRWLHAAVDVVATKKGMLAALELEVAGQEDLFAYTSGRMRGAAEALVARAKEAGAMRPEISTEDLLMALIGMCHSREREGWRDSVGRVLDIFVEGLRVR